MKIENYSNIVYILPSKSSKNNIVGDALSSVEIYIYIYIKKKHVGDAPSSEEKSYNSNQRLPFKKAPISCTENE